DRIDEVAIEGVTAHLAVGQDINSRRGLEGDGLVHCAVFDALELGVADGPALVLLARLLEICRAQQAPDNVTAICWHRRAPFPSPLVGCDRMSLSMMLRA